MSLVVKPEPLDESLEIFIEWNQPKILVDTLEPILLLHSTSALLTIEHDKIRLQSLCREKRSVFQRIFYAPKEVKIHGLMLKSESPTTRIHVVVNPTAILNSIHNVNSRVDRLLPKAQTICVRQRIAIPPELHVATEWVNPHTNPSSVPPPTAVSVPPTAFSVPPPTAVSVPSPTAFSVSSPTAVSSSSSLTPSSLNNSVSLPLIPDTKPRLHVSSIHWRWNSKQHVLRQQILGGYTNWVVLPTEMYHQSRHQFYNLDNNNNNNNARSGADTGGYCVHTHIGPTLNLDFIEMSILSPECTVTISPTSLSFAAKSDAHCYKPFLTTDREYPQRQQQHMIDSHITAEAMTHYSHHSEIITKNYWMILPEFLLEELWDRHQYSINDIHFTLDGMPERLIWQLLTAHHLSPTNAATHAWSDSETQLICGGKSAAITKLVKYFGDRHKEWKSRTDVTWNMSKKNDMNGDGKAYEIHKRHTPNLPVHRIPIADYERLSKLVKSPKLYAWRGITVVVREENDDRNLLMLTRVLPIRDYTELFVTKNTSVIREQPSIVLIDNKEFVLMDESFFFYKGNANEATKEEEPTRKRQKTMGTVMLI